MPVRLMAFNNGPTRLAGFETRTWPSIFPDWEIGGCVAKEFSGCFDWKACVVVFFSTLMPFSKRMTTGFVEPSGIQMASPVNGMRELFICQRPSRRSRFSYLTAAIASPAKISPSIIIIGTIVPSLITPSYMNFCPPVMTRVFGIRIFFSPADFGTACVGNVLKSFFLNSACHLLCASIS